MMQKILLFLFLVFFTASSFAQDVTDRNVQRRNPLRPFGEAAHVAFMGGSITEMDGYRPMVCEMLQKRFPDTKFTFTTAGISSTCSMTGAFRLERDVLSKGKVDLFFVEFAVNDDQDAHHSEQTAIRGMEGIIRHVRHQNPNTDIIVTFFVNEHLMNEYRAGREATSITAHRKVAEYYGISTINVAREVQQQIDEGKLTWQQFGGVHPAPLGNRIATNMIEYLFAEPKKQERGKPAAFPDKPLDPFCYENGRFVSPETAKYGDAWTWNVPDWKSIPGGFRQTFSGQKLLCCNKPNEELSFEFEGKAVGAFILAGPDAGAVEYRIDDKPAKQTVLLHAYSTGLHYPRTVMFDDELPPGKHVLRLKISTAAPEKSKGTAARILQFTVNE